VTTTSAPPAPAAAEAGDDAALALLRRFGDHTSAFLAYNDGTEHFTAPGIEGLAAYRTGGRRHAIQLCGPFAAERDRARLLDAFRDWAGGHGRRVTAVQLRERDAHLYAERGFAVDQLGSSYGIDLDEFTLRGTRFMKTRNKIKRAGRLGVRVEECSPQQLRRRELDAELAAVDRDWLRGKGRHVKELAFMIGERAGRGLPHRRVFVARVDGRAVAYVTYSPCYGERPGWRYDLTRRVRGAPAGTIELIFHTAVERLREEGCRWLHLGFTPFVGLSPEHELRGASSRTVRLVVDQLAKRGAAVYPARTQEAFKLKWAPQAIEPEYVAFEGRPTPGAVWQLMRVTRTL
jgi:lysylphosphatidylglycerol synthetase-like protein (DUF2156 family)